MPIFIALVRWKRWKVMLYIIFPLPSPPGPGTAQAAPGS